jgi:hypothetical protein
MSILSGIDPSKIIAIHILQHIGAPVLAAAMRVPVTQAVIDREADWIQFFDPHNQKTLRVKKNRIAMIEMQDDNIGDAGPNIEDIYEFG